MNAGNMNTFFRSRSHVTTLAGGAALVGLVLGVVLFTSAPAAEEPAKGGAPSMTVTTTMATQEQWPISLAASGSIEPWGEAIVGANILRDIFAAVTDIVGGRSGAYESALREARETALGELRDAARDLGGNAVVGVDIDYEVIGKSGSMLMVSVSGTAVIVE